MDSKLGKTFSNAMSSLFRKQTVNASPMPLFTELSPEDGAQLERQRAVVSAAATQHYGTVALTATKMNLPIIQKLLDANVFSKSQTYELQCLGVAFGDVLASELPLRWVMITDEFGTDPTLRLKDTSLNVNALTMISKRVEREEAVDVWKLLLTTREHLTDFERTSR